MFFFETLKKCINGKNTFIFLSLPCLSVVKGMTMQCKCELPTLPDKREKRYLLSLTEYMLYCTHCWEIRYVFFSQITRASGRHLGNTEHSTSRLNSVRGRVQVKLKSNVKLKMLDYGTCGCTAGGCARKLPAHSNNHLLRLPTLRRWLFSCTT